MGQEFHFRDKVPVAVLGATGTVGRVFVELLKEHPWFQLAHLIASDASKGKMFGEVAKLPKDHSEYSTIVKGLDPSIECSLVFSALDHEMAKTAEKEFVAAGHTVISCSKSHRMDPDVPLVVPEVNGNQVRRGLVTSPNCVVAGLALLLQPLHQAFGLQSVEISTLQSISGAGAKAKELDVENNIIPFIDDEEDKIIAEPKKILDDSSIVLSAQVSRVPIIEGHMAFVSFSCEKRPEKAQIVEAFNTFTGRPQELNLFSAPKKPIHYDEAKDYPQARHHKGIDKGMAISVGQCKPGAFDDWRCVMLVHNTVRGGAGNAVLIAEQMLVDGLLFW